MTSRARHQPASSGAAGQWLLSDGAIIETSVVWRAIVRRVSAHWSSTRPGKQGRRRGALRAFQRRCLTTITPNYFRRVRCRGKQRRVDEITSRVVKRVVDTRGVLQVPLCVCCQCDVIGSMPHECCQTNPLFRRRFGDNDKFKHLQTSSDSMARV